MKVEKKINYTFDLTEIHEKLNIPLNHKIQEFDENDAGFLVIKCTE